MCMSILPAHVSVHYLVFMEVQRDCRISGTVRDGCGLLCVLKT